MRKYRLPNGETTTNVDRYVNTWRKLAAPICAAMGGRLASFDPDLGILVGEKHYDISIVVAQVVADLFSEITHLRKYKQEIQSSLQTVNAETRKLFQ